MRLEKMISALLALVILATPLAAQDGEGGNDVVDFGELGWVKVQNEPVIWENRDFDPPKLYNGRGEAVVDRKGSLSPAQPMSFTDENGETADWSVAGNGGPNSRLAIVEDNDQVRIGENSMTYNDGLLVETGANSPDTPPGRRIMWIIRDARTGQAAAPPIWASNGVNSLVAPTFTQPGQFRLDNLGYTDTEAPTDTMMQADGVLKSGQEAKLDVIDVTAPMGGFAFIPEDSRQKNYVWISEHPRRLTDAYPIEDKKAMMYVRGDNFVPPDGDVDGRFGNQFQKNFEVPYGTPRPGDEQYLSENGRDETKIRTKNDFTLDEKKDDDFAGVKGFFVRTGVRTHFQVGPFEDNGSKPFEVHKTWALKIKNGDAEELHPEPPSYTFTIPNYPEAEGQPEYAFTCTYRDVSGNSTTINVPIHVLPAGIDIKKMDYRQGRGD